jgi:hypothetical protein
MNKHHWWIGIFVALLTAAGCEVGPNYETPKLKFIPPVYSQATTRPTSQPTDPQLAAIPSADDLRLWWQSFHDPIESFDRSRRRGQS